MTTGCGVNWIIQPCSPTNTSDESRSFRDDPVEPLYAKPNPKPLDVRGDVRQPALVSAGGRHVDVEPAHVFIHKASEEASGVYVIARAGGPALKRIGDLGFQVVVIIVLVGKRPHPLTTMFTGLNDGFHQWRRLVRAPAMRLPRLETTAPVRVA